MSKQVDRQLIIKYFNDNCSQEERALVEQFLNLLESEDLLNEILSERSLSDWTEFKQDNARNEKLPRWRNSIRQKIGVPYTIARVQKKPFFLRYAAVWIALALGFGSYGILHFKKNHLEAVAYFENVNPNGRHSVITLPDSSVIYLGAGSKLKYPDRFVGRTREISLSGEAFFEITKNPKRPFIIHTGNITTKVLGTSFKIEAFKNHPFAVEVATGKVRVDQHLGNHQIKSLAVLTPGQKITWSNGIAEIGHVAIEDVRMWKDARLAFNDKTLREIADELERWYNFKITFNNHIKSKERMTVTLNASVSVDKIFNVLGAAGNFKYDIEGKTITIK